MKKLFPNKKRALVVCFAIVFIISVFVFQAIALNEDGGILFNASSQTDENKSREKESIAIKKNQDDIISQSSSDDNATNTEKANIIMETKELMKLNVLGKEYKLNFDWIKQATDVGENDLLVYTNSDVKVEIDSKTNEIRAIRFYNQEELSKTATITETEIVNIAKEFVQQFYDLSKYNETKIFLNDSQKYVVNFVKTVCGIETSQYITVVLNNDNTIYSMYKSTDDFENIDTSEIEITEEEIKQRIYDKNEEGFNCSFQSIELVVIDSKVQAEVCYLELDAQGNYVDECAIIVDYIVIE